MNRKSIRDLIDTPEHRRLRHGPHAGTHCKCGAAMVPVCSERLLALSMQMHLPAAGERQRSQAPVSERQRSQDTSAYLERQATKQRRLDLLRRISTTIDADPLEVARRTHAQIRAEEEGLPA
jgi:hypothetical protein